MVCEPFTQWVLEDDFGGDRPPYEDVGVQIVDDVEPYELMKLRLLNASHQALCYLGYLGRLPLRPRGVPGLPVRRLPARLHGPGGDADAAAGARGRPGRYKHQLIERFANPEIRDTLARLCAESSDRIPKWLLPVIREQLAAGRRDLARGARGRVLGPVRRGRRRGRSSRSRWWTGSRDKLMERARHNREDPLVFISDPDLFGDLADERALRDRATPRHWSHCTSGVPARRWRHWSGDNRLGWAGEPATERMPD